jgi:hypothetical protein
VFGGKPGAKVGEQLSEGVGRLPGESGQSPGSVGQLSGDQKRSPEGLFQLSEDKGQSPRDIGRLSEGKSRVEFLPIWPARQES